MHHLKKVLFTLNVDDYAPEITELTYPLMRYWAKKIDAEFYVIDRRVWPDYPVTYEKLQIYDLAKSMELDWAIFFDSDALIHPETPDWTAHLDKRTVAHNGSDMASIRWQYDEYFLRDGRNIGSCNWCSIASDWCLDLWHPLDDITMDEAIRRIYPTPNEVNTVITPAHLIDDYVLSRNIAKYGLKFTTLLDLQRQMGLPQASFHWHEYTVPIPEKVEHMKDILKAWNVERILSQVRD